MAPCFMGAAACFFQTKNNAMPIKMYNVVHTGAKTASGGFQAGLAMVRYQPFTALAVNKPESVPTPSGMAMDISSFSQGFILQQFELLTTKYSN